MANIGQAIGNLSNRDYPPDEPRIVRQLVRLIGSAKTWQDMVEASDALFQVELRAKSLRDESNQMAAKEAARTLMQSAAQGQINATPFDMAIRQARNGAGY